MDKFAGDMYLDLYQVDTNIDDINLNAIWVDLDKGLLSDNIGQQCESIIKLTELFDKFQLPVFVNSGFLRLARVFQNGNNYIKLQVIRVIEKNKKHLGKIFNVDEISKLIFYNIHSNDAVCRSLTLRALGDISSIISDKHNVQHSIRLALESHDEIEAREAIFAADKFCSVSNSFASSLFDRICEIIEDIQSPIDRKLKLIPLFVHMQHDPKLSAKAQNLCKGMFYSFPRADISKIILNVLTKLACKSLTNIHETITFFLTLLHEEPREKLHSCLLKNLHILAKRVSHLWTKENLTSFTNYIISQKNNDLLLKKSSEILCTLAQYSNIYFLSIFQNDTNSLLNIIETMIFHDNIEISFNFCFISTTLLILQEKQNFYYSDENSNKSLPKKTSTELINNLFELTKNGLFSIILDADKSIENLLTTKNYQEKSTKNDLENFEKFLKKSLKCTIDLVKMKNRSYIKELYQFVCSSLLNSIDDSHRANLYCEILLTLCKFDNSKSLTCNRLININNQKTQILMDKDDDKLQDLNEEDKQEIIAQILLKLFQAENKNEAILVDSNLQLKMINLLLELEIRKPDFLNGVIKNSIHNETKNHVEVSIDKFLEINKDSWWNIFKISRVCVRYAYYKYAQEIYEKMSHKMVKDSIENISSTELSYSSWVDFMGMLCKAEHLLSYKSIKTTTNVNEIINLLNKSLSIYMRAQILFKSNCTKCLSYNNNNMIPSLETTNICFQIRYCELRSEQIKLYMHLILSSMSYQTIPPPVFQFKSSENMSKLGKFGQSLKFIILELQKLNQKYKEFTSECFDADEHTINILNICKKQIECLIFCINLLISPRSEQSVKDEFCTNFMSQPKNDDINNNQSTECTAEIKLNETFYVDLFNKIILLCSQENINSQFSRLKQFQNILMDFIVFPLPLPRAFFTTLQRTQIKLIVNPNTKKTNQFHQIRYDQTLVIKIDGIINQQVKVKKPIRKIKKVQISLTTELDSKSIQMPIKFSDVKTSTETPKDDYFNTNILINFPYTGNYSISVDLYILDENDSIWRYIAERHQILIKVDEDPNRQKLFAALAASTSTAQTSVVISSNNQIGHAQQQTHQANLSANQSSFQSQQSRLAPVPSSNNQDYDKMET